MFFVHQGEVGYVIPELEDFVCLKISAGGHFGERSLIYAVPRDFCCKALADTVVWSLDLDWFGKIFFQEYRSAGSILKEMSDERYSKLIKIHNEMLARVSKLLASRGHILSNQEIVQAGPKIANTLHVEGNLIRKGARKTSNSSMSSLINMQSSLELANQLSYVVTNLRDRLETR